MKTVIVSSAGLLERQLGVMLERGLGESGRLGQGDPELDAVQLRVVLNGRLLGVRDPASGGHQVELARPDHLLGAETVAVQHVPASSQVTVWSPMCGCGGTAMPVTPSTDIGP